tara:strand:- start:5088 stop:5405 length:318 start_codon:yes stop_codon:yes gene_type:complete
MFTRKVDSDSKDLFFISSADWEVVAEGNDATEAATIAVERHLGENPTSTNISTVILALNISKCTESIDASESIEILYAPKILANAGYHSESKKLQYIIDEIKAIS